MAQEISQVIDSYIYQEQILQNQLTQIRKEKSNIKTEIGKELITEIAKGYLGRTGGKLARKAIIQAEKESLKSREAEIDSRHQQIVFHVKSFLGTVSEWKKDLKQPNSHKLIGRIETAQKGVKVATRIRSTINALSVIKYKQLVYNSEIPLVESKSILVDAGNPFSASLELRKILGSITDYVKIIDPYIDIKSLELLFCIPDKVPIKVLTEYTGGKSKRNRLLRSCNDFKIEKPLFEIRICSNLHDRFIISKRKGWSIGTSLKDFGNRMSVLTMLSESLKQEVERKFDKLWLESETLI
jgi:hypothetical protein